MSLNVCGLNDRRLRRAKFNWIRRTKSQTILLQETHGSLKNENYWKHEWGNKIIFNHGTVDNRGVAILFVSHFNYEIIKEYQLFRSRFLVVDLIVDDWQIFIGNNYAPNKEKEKILFFEGVNKFLEQNVQIGSNLILGGHWNLIRTLQDKAGGVARLRQAPLNSLETLIFPELADNVNKCDNIPAPHTDQSMVFLEIYDCHSEKFGRSYWNSGTQRY